jgi:hypothetical protein
MYFLPIVGRELRIAARRKGTYRIRVWTTFAALLVSFCFMLFKAIFGNFMPSLGPNLFRILTWYAFLMSLLAGVFFAGDCISSEKREGTLGLLFLTDLKGYDVVLGKIISVGLSASYGLIAMLPVIGLPLLMGGVTGGEFWRVSLALVNALFFALATGILVSACSRESSRALGNTIGWLVLATLILPAVGALIRVTRLPSWCGYFTFLSPFYPFSIGFEALYLSRSQLYWISLLTSHLVAWFMLILASWILPRAWQEKAFHSQKRAMLQSAGSLANRSVWPIFHRPKLLDNNPIQWLAESFGGVRHWAWWLVIIEFSSMAIILCITRSLWIVTGASYVLILGGWLLKILFAFQTCRFFVEARRSGALELILSTPLKSREIIDGQWRALVRIFLWPCVIFLAAMLLVAIVQMTHTSAMFASFRPKTAGGANPYFNPATFPFGIFQLFGTVYQTARWITDIIAIGWVGMWLSLSMKQPNLAAPATILFAAILPSAAFCVPNPVIDLCLILWARGKLLNEFRRVVMPQYHSGSFGPGLAPPPIIPPVSKSN